MLPSDYSSLHKFRGANAIIHLTCTSQDALARLQPEKQYQYPHAQTLSLKETLDMLAISFVAQLTVGPQAPSQRTHLLHLAP